MLWWTLRQLRSKDSRKRGFAVVGLGKSGNAKPVDPLITALRDPVWGVRRLAVEALEGLKYEPADESHKAMMLVACHKWDEAVKLGPAAIEPLVGEFRDHDYSVRGRAADA